MTKRLLGHDPLTGITDWFRKDPVTGNIELSQTQDVTRYIEANKALQNEAISKGEGREMWHAATVPMVVLHQWANESGVMINDKAFSEVVKRKLNDPDNRLFRTGVFKL